MKFSRLLIVSERMDPKKGRVLWKRAFEAAPTPPESEVEDPDA